MHQKYQDDLYYLKSSKTKIDIDFFLPEERMAIQACYALKNQETINREVGQLKKLDATKPGYYKLIIVTMDEDHTIPLENREIQVISLKNFLLN